MTKAANDDPCDTEGVAMLASLCSHVDTQLSLRAPNLEWATVFWTRGEHASVTSNIVFSRQPNDPIPLEAIRTAARANEEACSGLQLHGLDTPERVCFYEQEFYVLSSFSAFSLRWKDWLFPTLEHAYHWEKFIGRRSTDAAAPSVPDVCSIEERLAVADKVRCAPSAHMAFTIAQCERARRRPDWDDVKVDIMRDLLRTKIEQHEYVFRKLMQTDGRTLVENSWRDDFWGWGENRDGHNMLGQLWMELRAELRQAALYQAGAEGAAYPTPWALWVLTEHA